MMHLSTIGAALSIFCTAGSLPEMTQFAPGGSPIVISLSNTEAAQAFRALAERTGVNIVYSNPEKLPLSLSVKASNVEEGVRIIAAAGALSYRRVGAGYVVAPESRLRQALAPYTRTLTFSIPSDAVDDTAKEIEQMLPMTSVTKMQDRIIVRGLPEDLAVVRPFVTERFPDGANEKRAVELVSVRSSAAAQAGNWLTALVPRVKLTAAPGATLPTVIALSGPAAAVEQAKQLLTDLDARATKDNQIVVRTLDLNYLTADRIEEFLKKAAPDVEAMSGPMRVTPPRVQFNSITGILNTVRQASGNGGGGNAQGNGQGQQDQQAGQQSSTDDTVKRRTVVLRGREEDVQAAIELLKGLDTKPKQVQISVNVAEVSPTFTDNRGVSWNWSNISFFENNNSTKPLTVGPYGRGPFDFNATLDALVRTQDARVLAKPSLQTTDNEGATVFIGDMIRSRIVTNNGLGGTSVDIREFPIGIILQIHPRVAEDGSIHVRVSPVVSTVTALSEDNVPQTSTREADTTVIVKDGDTIVLSGLIREEDTKTVSEVPYLSKLPIIGELFRSRRTNKRRTELVVSITPRIVP